MKEIKKLEVLEKGQKLELSTYSLKGGVVFERAEFGGKIVYFSIHDNNTVDKGRFFHYGPEALWPVEVSSFREFDKYFGVYVRLLTEEPTQTQKKEFKIPGTDIVRGGEIEVLVLKSKDEEGNFILPDSRTPGIKLYFQVPYWDEEQNQKLNNPASIGKMKAVVDYINVMAPTEGRPRVYNIRVLLQGEPISKPIFNQFWTGRVYRVAVDRTVKINPRLMSVRQDNKTVYFCIDTQRVENKDSKQYMLDHPSFTTIDLFVTRGEVKDNSVMIYGIVFQVGRQQSVA